MFKEIPESLLATSVLVDIVTALEVAVPSQDESTSESPAGVSSRREVATGTAVDALALLGIVDENAGLCSSVF